MSLLSEDLIKETQEFYKKFFEIEVDLMQEFNFDYLDAFPFAKPLLVLTPQGITTPFIIQKLKSLGVNVESEDWIKTYFMGRITTQANLKVIDWSDRPSKETLGKSPNQILTLESSLRNYRRSFISLQEYLIATALVFATTGKFLEERFSTYFPELIQSGCIARSDARRFECRIIINACNSSMSCGARVAISIPLR